MRCRTPTPSSRSTRYDEALPNGPNATGLVPQYGLLKEQWHHPPYGLSGLTTQNQLTGVNRLVTAMASMGAVDSWHAAMASTEGSGLVTTAMSSTEFRQLVTTAMASMGAASWWLQQWPARGQLAGDSNNDQQGGGGSRLVIAAMTSRGAVGW